MPIARMPAGTRRGTSGRTASIPPMVCTESCPVWRPYRNAGGASRRRPAHSSACGAHGGLAGRGLVERSGLTLDRQQFLFDVLGKHSEPDNRYKLGGPAVVGGESALQR